MARRKDSRKEYQRIHDQSISEIELQRSLIEVAEMFGWKCHHENDSRRSNPGLPDLICAHPRHGIVFIELKSERGYLRQPQKAWRDVLIAGGVPYYVFRPRDRFVADDLFREGKFPPADGYCR